MLLILQELGTKAAVDDIQKAKLVKDGPRYRMCVDVAAYVTQLFISMHYCYNYVTADCSYCA